MGLAIPGSSVRSYWRPVGGHGRSLGGHAILVMGRGGVGDIFGIFWRHFWGYLGDILGYTGDILGISRK